MIISSHACIGCVNLTFCLAYIIITSDKLRQNQGSAYEKQGRATIARLVMKFRGYKRAKSRTPLTK